MDLIPQDTFHPMPLEAHMEECENCCGPLKSAPSNVSQDFPGYTAAILQHSGSSTELH